MICETSSLIIRRSLFAEYRLIQCSMGDILAETNSFYNVSDYTNFTNIYRKTSRWESNALWEISWQKQTLFTMLVIIPTLLTFTERLVVEKASPARNFKRKLFLKDTYKK